MLGRSAFLTTLALPVLLGAGGARAEDKAPGHAYVGLTGTSTHMGTGDHSWGHCNGVVVFDNDRPLVCFGLKKQPKEKGEYLYLLLFKNGPGKLVNQGISGAITSKGGGTDEKLHITLGEKAVDIALQAAIDEKTQALKDEVIQVGGREVKGGDARVFLVDLTQKGVTYRPVKAALPAEVPDLGDTEHKTWAATMLRAVRQLRKNSPEVEQFLGP